MSVPFKQFQPGKHPWLIGLAVLTAAASTLSAANPVQPSPPASPAGKKSDARDPNRKICEIVDLSGTRFRRTRVCMSAAEWTEQRRQDRALIDRIQTSTCVAGAGC